MPEVSVTFRIEDIVKVTPIKIYRGAVLKLSMKIGNMTES